MHNGQNVLIKILHDNNSPGVATFEDCVDACTNCLGCKAYTWQEDPTPTPIDPGVGKLTNCELKAEYSQQQQQQQGVSKMSGSRNDCYYTVEENELNNDHELCLSPPQSKYGNYGYFVDCDKNGDRFFECDIGEKLPNNHYLATGYDGDSGHFLSQHLKKLGVKPSVGDRVAAYYPAHMYFASPGVILESSCSAATPPIKCNEYKVLIGSVHYYVKQAGFNGEEEVWLPAYLVHKLVGIDE